jgi:hypothetical protein
MLATQPVCHNAFDGGFCLDKFHAKIFHAGIFLRIQAGIDRCACPRTNASACAGSINVFAPNLGLKKP